MPPRLDFQNDQFLQDADSDSESASDYGDEKDDHSKRENQQFQLIYPVKTLEMGSLATIPEAEEEIFVGVTRKESL